MQILVTGGAGFIGSNLVLGLLEKGHAVRIIDNFSTGRRDNLAAVGPHVELIEGDIRSYHVVAKAVRGVEVVYHQAALPSVPRSINDPLTTHEVNVTGTLNLLDAAVQEGVRRFVYASSSSVYGDSPELPKVETMVPRPLSPYAAAKLAGEHYCRIFSQLYGLETVALRYFNVFGPRQDPSSQYSAVVPKFIQLIGAGERPRIFGDGEQSRDFTYISNVVAANLLAGSVYLEPGFVVNCACEERTSLNDLVSVINRMMGREVEPIYDAPRPGDVQHSLADITLAREKLGYAPTVGLDEGIRRTVEHMQE